MNKKLIPTNTKREDCVQTPITLALDIMNYFKPYGNILEPCKGKGNFIEAYENYNLISQLEGNEGIKWTWCEILEGKDFFDFKDKADWIITNPPYSIFRKFLNHSMKVADNIIFLTSINHFWLKVRLRDMKEQNFGIKEITLIDTPKEFPQSGFQFGCVHIQKNYKGKIEFTRLNEQINKRNK